MKCALVFVLACSLSGVLASQTTQDQWKARETPFRALNVFSTGQALWICGPDESIASSSDDGATWKVRNQKTDGNTLLGIEFKNENFGYAFGTGGLVLITEDGGEKWSAHKFGSDTILQASFADPQHGIIRTLSALLLTTDGGEHLQPIATPQDSEQTRRLKYSFSLQVLDSTHMAVLLKEGGAQYFGGAFLVTQDAGKTWTLQTIPDSVVASFFSFGGKYWSVGHEVVDKQNRGGHSVPLVASSTDGIAWTKLGGDLSVCQLHGCTLCHHEGCFAANGVLARLFESTIRFQEFPTNKNLGNKWAATNSTICTVSEGLQCAALMDVNKPDLDTDVTVPPMLAPAAIGSAPQGSTVHCISCAMEPVLISSNVGGRYAIKLTVSIAPNGIVKDVSVSGAPNDEIKAKVGSLAKQWLFEPYVKEGNHVAVTLNTTVNIMVIKR